MIKQGNKVISNTQIKILSSNEITKETIEKVLTGEISSHTHDGTYVKKDDPRLSDSRPASDVSAWAKASIKPSYSASEITGLSNIAKTGSYNDLSNKPTIPTVDVNKAYVDGALATKADLVSGKIPLSQLPEIPSPITVDSSLSSTSTNPVQNKVINTALGNKVDKVSGKELSTNDYTTNEKNKLSRIEWVVDQAPSIEYEEDKIKFSTHRIAPSSGTTNNNSFYINGANSSKSGLMTASDKNKLDGIATGANKYIHPTSSGNKHIPAGGASGQILRWGSDGTAVWGNNYSLPTATSSVLGGVKTGANITNSSGTISITKDNVAAALGYTPAKPTVVIDWFSQVDSESSKTITSEQYDTIYNSILNKDDFVLFINSFDDPIVRQTFYSNYTLIYGPNNLTISLGGCVGSNNSVEITTVSLTFTKNSQGECKVELTSNDITLNKYRNNSNYYLNGSGSYTQIPRVTSSNPGLAPQLPDDATKFLDGKGNWSTVNTVLKPGVSDIFKRILSASEAVRTVTQVEWDTLVAATPEVDKTYFFSITEEFINNGTGMCYDKGFITRSTSSVEMFINGILPQYPQYLVGASVNATTKACRMIVYGNMIYGDGNELSISSITVDGDNQISSGLTFTINGDGSKALMDDGSYKPVSSDYIIDYLDMSGSTGRQTFTITEARYNEIKTAFENKRNIVLYILSGLAFYKFSLGISYGESFIFTSTSTGIDNSNTYIGISAIELIIEPPVNAISEVIIDIRNGSITAPAPKFTITLPDNFSVNTTYTSDQIGNMLRYTSWNSFYNNFVNGDTAMVKFSAIDQDGTHIYNLSPSEVIYDYDSNSKVHSMIVTVCGYAILATQGKCMMCVMFVYNETDSTYELNAAVFGQL